MICILLIAKHGEIVWIMTGVSDPTSNTNNGPNFVETYSLYNYWCNYKLFKVKELIFILKSTFGWVPRVETESVLSLPIV
jgi:hypothetical protein